MSSSSAASALAAGPAPSGSTQSANAVVFDVSDDTSPHHNPRRRSKRDEVHRVPRKMPHVTRDANGAPVLPLAVGVLTVTSLGHIRTDSSYFHNARYIFPVGYEARRPYQSMKFPEKHTVVTCRVLESDDKPMVRARATLWAAPRCVAGAPQHLVAQALTRAGAQLCARALALRWVSQFEIVADDDPENPLQASTATGAV